MLAHGCSGSRDIFVFKSSTLGRSHHCRSGFRIFRVASTAVIRRSRCCYRIHEITHPRFRRCGGRGTWMLRDGASPLPEATSTSSQLESRFCGPGPCFMALTSCRFLQAGYSAGLEEGHCLPCIALPMPSRLVAYCSSASLASSTISTAATAAASAQPKPSCHMPPVGPFILRDGWQRPPHEQAWMGVTSLLTLSRCWMCGQEQSTSGPPHAAPHRAVVSRTLDFLRGGHGRYKNLSTRAVLRCM